MSALSEAWWSEPTGLGSSSPHPSSCRSPGEGRSPDPTPSGVELGVVGTHCGKPACWVTWGKALLLSGPQNRPSQRLLFMISAEGSLLEKGGGAGEEGTREMVVLSREFLRPPASRSVGHHPPKKNPALVLWAP